MLYIFDLDGTLADTSHRDHLAREGKWDEYYAACVRDMPIPATVDTFINLKRAGAEIYIFTGRSEQVRKQTETWLFLNNLHPDLLMMRPEKNFKKDFILKAEWYDRLPPLDKEDLIAVFEDRQQAVDMWRAKGITCYQVAPGNF